MIDKSPALLPRGPLKVHDSLPHYGNFINGQQVAPQGGRFFASNEPFSGQPWAMIAEADAADVDAATQAAWRAGNEGAWASFRATEGGRCLLRDRKSVVQGKRGGRRGVHGGGRSHKKK